ncbi:MAG TPA: competence/damage-inducible protein A [Sedimentisphaerales bacterium]|nr:competence/damage-inducible protein A [Sedimentisphaerales bacterium]
MKTASIVSIGNEVLSGQTIDTNASYLSGELLAIGIPVVSVYAIGDDIDSIARAFCLAAGDGDIVLATGGLGPTDDDVTREALAKFLGSKLVFEEKLLRKIEDFFERRTVEMSPRNKVQAYIPVGSKALENNIGTAPGIMAQAQGKLIIALPGVPSEMKQMFEESVLERLKEVAGGQALAVRKLKCFGAGESSIAELLGPLMQRGRDPLINSTACHGVITLHIVATAGDEDAAKEMADEDEKLLLNMLGELVYGTGEQTLAQVVGQKLRQGNKTLAVAESCTGGILAALLTDVPGASDYFMLGWVTYSNSAKISELGVGAELIEKYGAVSEPVAVAMAEGARRKGGTDYAIAITGIAGPGGGTEQKPVGRVYISVVWAGRSETKGYFFSGDRDSIRLRAAQTALNILRLKLMI